jgi:PHP family Zn ribbon phosphoesterase
MAERDYQKGVFYGSLIQRIQFHGVVMHHTQNDVLPFDYGCSSARKELKRRVCSICKQYIPSAYRMKNHYKIHQQQYASNCLDYNNEMFTNEYGLENDDEEADMISSQRPLPVVSNPSGNGVVIFSDMLDWLKSDFEELDLKEQIIKTEDKKQMR